jgi:hypothetical protein
VLGDKWEIAIDLLQIFGVIAALSQIAFNWNAYFTAIGNTKPMAVDGALMLVTFCAVGVPLMFSEGLIGYGIGMVAVMAVSLTVRTFYLTRLFSGLSMLRHATRALLPSVPAILLVLGVRMLESGERTPAMALGELALYALATAIATWLAERELVREMMGYLRSRSKAPQPA